MDPPKKTVWKRLLTGTNPRRTAIRVGILVFIGVILTSVIVPVRVSGTSMEPTYRDGTIVLINRLAWLRGLPRRGDVVVIRWAGNQAWLLKRIIALPGEQIEIVNGLVRINGETLSEAYAQLGNMDWNAKPQSLDPDEYLVIGDNRAMPQSEHEFGRVSKARIIGKALF